MKFPELTYTSPVKFSAAQQIQLAVVPPLAWGAISLLMSTTKYVHHQRQRFDGLMERDGRLLLAFWHESMVLSCWQYRGSSYHTITSYSFDGEMAARIVGRSGQGAVRGSSSKGGGEGLRELVKATRYARGVAITPDGPRGPRRVAKAGIALLAARTGLSIVPHAYIPLRARRLNSWDRFPVPMPFSTIVVAYGEPVPPPKSEDPADIEKTRLEVEVSLNRLHECVENGGAEALTAAGL